VGTDRQLKATILGARPGSGNIGAAIAEELRRCGWDAHENDCAIGDGSRPPGGNLPNDEVAAEFGYNKTELGRYQRFDVPSFQDFKRRDADALVITLGRTYKDHWKDVKPGTLDAMIRANVTLPLEAARRFVQAEQRILPARANDQLRHIVFTGSYAHDHPFTNGTLYCATKAALDVAARALGWELTDLGYRVHVIHPYHVQGTPVLAQVENDVMSSKGMTWEEADAYNRKDLKMPDLLTPGEVASVVRVLLTEPAMGWLSGQSLNLYGGSR
jgi:NAD(P)-dependent dehydrogenase (short-subunit alcohol dehydrogenase family)